MADNSFFTGVQTGAALAAQRFDQSMRVQQLRLQQAQQAMGERQLAAQAQMYLQHASLYKQQADQEQEEQYLKKAAGDRFVALMQAGNDIDEAYDEATRPLMVANPKLYTDLINAKANMKRATTDATPFTPKAVAVDLPGGGKINVLQTGPNSAQNLDKEPGPTGVQKDLEEADRLLAEADSLDATNKPLADRYRARALMLQKAHTKEELEVEVGPNGTIIRQGPGGGKVPMGVATKVSERLSQTEKALDTLSDLSRTIRAEDVGFKGVLGEVFLDKALPQLGVASADVTRMDNRTKLRTLAEGLMRQVSADSRFSNADRESIKSILPSAGALESLEHTQQTIKTLSKIFAKRALIDAKEGKRPPPVFALRALDDDGLLEAKEAGLITADEALAEFRRKHAK